MRRGSCGSAKALAPIFVWITIACHLTIAAGQSGKLWTVVDQPNQSDNNKPPRSNQQLHKFTYKLSQAVGSGGGLNFSTKHKLGDGPRADKQMNLLPTIETFNKQTKDANQTLLTRRILDQSGANPGATNKTNLKQHLARLEILSSTLFPLEAQFDDDLDGNFQLNQTNSTLTPMAWVEDNSLDTDDRFGGKYHLQVSDATLIAATTTAPPRTVHQKTITLAPGASQILDDIDTVVQTSAKTNDEQIPPGALISANDVGLLSGKLNNELSSSGTGGKTALQTSQIANNNKSSRSFAMLADSSENSDTLNASSNYINHYDDIQMANNRDFLGSIRPHRNSKFPTNLDSLASWPHNRQNSDPIGLFGEPQKSVASSAFELRRNGADPLRATKPFGQPSSGEVRIQSSLLMVKNDSSGNELFGLPVKTLIGSAKLGAPMGNKLPPAHSNGIGNVALVTQHQAEHLMGQWGANLAGQTGGMRQSLAATRLANDVKPLEWLAGSSPTMGPPRWPNGYNNNNNRWPPVANRQTSAKNTTSRRSSNCGGGTQADQLAASSELDEELISSSSSSSHQRRAPESGDDEWSTPSRRRPAAGPHEPLKAWHRQQPAADPPRPQPLQLSRSASSGIRVVLGDESSARPILVNSRGLIVAAKKHHQQASPPPPLLAKLAVTTTSGHARGKPQATDYNPAIRFASSNAVSLAPLEHSSYGSTSSASSGTSATPSTISWQDHWQAGIRPGPTSQKSAPSAPERWPTTTQPSISPSTSEPPRLASSGASTTTTNDSTAITSLGGSSGTASTANFQHNPPYKQLQLSSSGTTLATMRPIATTEAPPVQPTMRPNDRFQSNQVQKHQIGQQLSDGLHDLVNRRRPAGSPAQPTTTRRRPGAGPQVTAAAYEAPPSGDLTPTGAHGGAASAGSAGAGSGARPTRKGVRHKLQQLLAPGSSAAAGGTKKTSGPSKQQHQESASAGPVAAPLLSGQAASNVAQLLAQSLQALVRPPPSVARPLGSMLAGLRPATGGFGGGSSHLGGAGGKLKQRLGPWLSAAIIHQQQQQHHHHQQHSIGPLGAPAVTRRTAPLGPLLVSGLVYGLSVLPALMALTGVNPFQEDSEPVASGNSRKQAQHQQQHQQRRRANPGSSGAKGPTTSNTEKRRPQSDRSAASALKQQQLQLLNDLDPRAGQFAYLVPLVGTHNGGAAGAAALDEVGVVRPIPGDDAGTLVGDSQPSDLRALYAPPPTILEAPDPAGQALQLDSLVGSLLDEQSGGKFAALVNHISSGDSQAWSRLLAPTTLAADSGQSLGLASDPYRRPEAADSWLANGSQANQLLGGRKLRDLSKLTTALGFESRPSLGSGTSRAEAAKLQLQTTLRHPSEQSNLSPGFQTGNLSGQKSGSGSSNAFDDRISIGGSTNQPSIQVLATNGSASGWSKPVASANIDHGHHYDGLGGHNSDKLSNAFNERNKVTQSQSAAQSRGHHRHPLATLNNQHSNADSIVRINSQAGSGLPSAQLGHQVLVASKLVVGSGSAFGGEETSSKQQQPDQAKSLSVGQSRQIVAPQTLTLSGEHLGAANYELQRQMAPQRHQSSSVMQTPANGYYWQSAASVASSRSSSNNNNYNDNNNNNDDDDADNDNGDNMDNSQLATKGNSHGVDRNHWTVANGIAGSSSDYRAKTRRLASNNRPSQARPLITDLGVASGTTGTSGGQQDGWRAILMGAKLAAGNNDIDDNGRPPVAGRINDNRSTHEKARLSQEHQGFVDGLEETIELLPSSRSQVRDRNQTENYQDKRPNWSRLTSNQTVNGKAKVAAKVEQKEGQQVDRMKIRPNKKKKRRQRRPTPPPMALIDYQPNETDVNSTNHLGQEIPRVQAHGGISATNLTEFAAYDNGGETELLLAHSMAMGSQILNEPMEMKKLSK